MKLYTIDKNDKIVELDKVEFKDIKTNISGRSAIFSPMGIK